MRRCRISLQHRNSRQKNRPGRSPPLSPLLSFPVSHKGHCTVEGNIRFTPIGRKRTVYLLVSRGEGFSFHLRELTRFLQRQTTSTSSKRARSLSQETENGNKLRAVDRDFTASTYEPSPNIPNRAPSITVRGKILLSFGLKVDKWKKENEELSILKADVPLVPHNVQYMYEMLDRQRQLMVERCETFGRRLCEIWKRTEPEDSDVHSVENIMARPATLFRTYGRIFLKAEKGTHKKIILLEGCEPFKGNTKSTVVRMNFDRLKSYAIFPGQIIGVEGILNTKGVLTATQLFTKGHVRLFDAPKLCKDIKIYVAAGPFTSISDLNYQPLWDFMERVAEDEPDVLVLIGPFMEVDHPNIRDLSDTFGDFFHKLLSKILHYLQGKFTRVILVPSYRDAHHDSVFPTPEFVLNSNKVGPTSTIVHCMPDPCIININGLHIGITSVDSLKHFGLKELSFQSATDRISRLADHLLSQASFYPMYPYFKGLPFDITLWKEYGCFPKQPHIMILPSDIKFYCKSISNCLVVNPERLHKYNYARICVKPVRNDTWEPNDVSCEIAKV
ncbi:DNA polymerase alpha subunit B isoform X2 [Ceratina calcarata]|uniref:DNA polymerase alpha subunit B n=1 Tax=Ceratina calcarata TaxID=156304 RepID=A0AAJ7S544_9HYME|nr:DNA polymerase alpha subunit B isoform X2 [Ceratina calcarata]